MSHAVKTWQVIGSFISLYKELSWNHIMGCTVLRQFTASINNSNEKKTPKILKCKVRTLINQKWSKYQEPYFRAPSSRGPCHGRNSLEPTACPTTQDASEPPHTYLTCTGCLQSSCSCVCAVMLLSWSVTQLRCVLPARLCVGSGLEMCSKA